MKKLSLNKETIANLNSDIMKRLNGGSVGRLTDQTCPVTCVSRKNSCDITLTCATNFNCVDTVAPPCGF